MLAVVPAVLIVVLPTVASVAFTLIESMNGSAGVDVYRRLLVGESQVTEFWQSVGFSFAVGVASTLIAGLLSLFLVSWWHQHRPVSRSNSPSLFFYSLVVSIPHLGWAAALFLLISQSGILARFAFSIGMISEPSGFPELVADSSGLGLIVHYVTKETPFIVVAAVAALSTQPPGLNDVAASLGAGWLRRVRYVTWPVVRPAMLGSMLISFGFVLHSVEAPLVLGASQPRMLSVVAAELFSEPSIDRRSTAAALGVLLALVAAFFGGVGALFIRRRRS